MGDEIPGDSGTLSASVKYKPWGGERDSSGTMRTTFRFTGQRSEEAGIGLYYYGARWYDSALGRWAQADTLIPNPGNVLDWDRYSYVRNNPLKYTDPTGQFCNMVGSNEICSADPDSNGHWLPNSSSTTTSSPQPVIHSKLTTSSSVTGIGGAQLYWLYQQVWSYTAGWWWKSFGADGIFDIWDFVGLILYYEGNYFLDTYFQEGAVRAFFGWCNFLGCSGNSPTSVLNWLAAASQTAAGMYYLVRKGEDIGKVFYQFIQDGASIDPTPAQNTANLFRNSPPAWKSGWDYFRPYYWGNYSLLPSQLRKYLTVNEASLWVLIINPLNTNYNPFFIPSGCVWKYWLDKGDLGVRCPMVR